MTFRRKFSLCLRHTKIVATIAMITYVLSEITFYILLCSGVLNTRIPWEADAAYGNQKDCIYYSPIAGYKMRPGKMRVLKLLNGRVVWDNVVRCNNYGYLSEYDYFPEKKSDTYRFIILGDSFTQGTHLQVRWHERLQQLLNQLPDKRGYTKFEVYAFAVGGGGLLNWHQIFFYEIVPNFDFDALIFGVIFDDFSRDFRILHAVGDGYYAGMFPKPPNSYTEFINSYLPEMDFLGGMIKTDDELDSIRRTHQSVGWHWREAKLYVANYVCGLLLKPNNKVEPRWDVDAEFKRNAKRLEEKISKIGNMDTDFIDFSTSDWGKSGEIIQRYGTDRFIKICRMVSWCKKTNKPVLFAAIPYGRMVITRNNTGFDNPCQHELRTLAEIFKEKYFDGYDVFTDVTEKNQFHYWLEGDGHWTQAGSDRFTEKIVPTVADLIVHKIRHIK